MSLHAHIQSMVWVEGGQSWRGGGAREARALGYKILLVGGLFFSRGRRGEGSHP